MPKPKRPPSRAQRQLADTEGMTGAEIEAYVLALEGEVSAELAARYLSGPGEKLYAQGIRLLMRSGELPVGTVSGNRCHIYPQRLVKWKRGELGLDTEMLTREIAKAFEKASEVIAELIRSAAAKSGQ